MVKVRYSEGVAIHTDPESCAGHCREAVREALTGGCTGEVLSGESNLVRGADAVVACRSQQARVRPGHHQPMRKLHRWAPGGYLFALSLISTWRHHKSVLAL
jgi:hypothetical protein